MSKNGWHRPEWRCRIAVALYWLLQHVGRLADRIDPPTRHMVRPSAEDLERFAAAFRTLGETAKSTESLVLGIADKAYVSHFPDC